MLTSRTSLAFKARKYTLFASTLLNMSRRGLHLSHLHRHHHHCRHRQVGARFGSGGDVALWRLLTVWLELTLVALVLLLARKEEVKAFAFHKCASTRYCLLFAANSTPAQLPR